MVKKFAKNALFSVPFILVLEHKNKRQIKSAAYFCVILN